MSVQPLIGLLRDWWWLLTVLSNLIFPIIMLYLRDKFTTREELTKQTAALTVEISTVQDEVKGVDRRLVTLENVMGGLPNRETFHAMAERIGAVERAVAVTSEAVSGVKDLVGKVDRTLTLMLENQLRENGK